MMNHLYDNIQLGSNELVSKFTINRNIKKLLWNDQYIYKVFNKHLKSGPGVFIKGLKYPFGYKVWFRNEDGYLGIYTNKLDNNLQSPLEAPDTWVNTSVAALPNGELSYDEHYRNKVDAQLSIHLANYHDGNPELVHANLDNTDFQLYPCKTKFFKSGDGYVTGYVRKWQSQVLEYYIIYRFKNETISQMSPSDVSKYFGGMLNAYGADLKSYSNPTTSTTNVNEYFETDTVRSIDIQFDTQFQFADNSYCIFTSNALDTAGYENNINESPDKNNYSPIDTVQIYNKTANGFSVMRRFNGGSFVGDYVTTENLEDYLCAVYKRLKPADKCYTAYIVGTWK